MEMLWLVFICFPFVLTEASNYHQNDYTVKLERVELVNYNRSYIRNITCGLVHYNRTYRAINGSGHLIKDIGMNIKVDYQSFKFLSNEYRFFPLTLTVNGCNELERDTFGVVESFQKSVNVKLRCPFKPGFYGIVYGQLNYSNFPPYIPGGQYKNVVKLYENSNFLMELHFYVIIEEILKKWEN